MKKTEDKHIDYSSLIITLKNGNMIEYGKGEWNDYRYTGSAVAVIDSDGVWKAIYSFSEVFSVELK